MPPSSPATKPMEGTLNDHRSNRELRLSIPSAPIVTAQTATFILRREEELGRSQTALETVIPHRPFMHLPQLVDTLQ